MTVHETMAFLRTLRIDPEDARALLLVLVQLESQGQPAPDGGTWREALRRLIVEGQDWLN
jgi:hypothetical protein